MITPFMFGTGIENSYPTINNGRTRVDEMEKCGSSMIRKSGPRFR